VVLVYLKSGVVLNDKGFCMLEILGKERKKIKYNANLYLKNKNLVNIKLYPLYEFQRYKSAYS
jgi:hypothetical protein